MGGDISGQVLERCPVYAFGQRVDPPLATVQRALGHASATVTLKTYAHLWPTAEDRTRAAAAAMLADALSADAANQRAGVTL